MNPGGARPLAEQRQALRAQLFAQRQQLAEQLAVAPRRGGYPRSKTMRFLIQRPALLAGLATLLLGTRFAGPVSAVLTFPFIRGPLPDLRRLPVSHSAVPHQEQAP